MVRVLSALVLLPVIVAVIWLLPPLATLVLAEAVVLVAAVEYCTLAARLGRRVSRSFVVVAAMTTCAALASPGAPVEVVVMAAVVAGGALAVGAGWRETGALSDASVALFAPIYLGLPLGAVAALRATTGHETVLLLLLVVMASDTAQYYGGRWLGRRPLAPAISPKKTREGAVFGVVAASAVMVAGGRWWLSTAGPLALATLGATLALLGIAGDLFESAIKRGAGVKDASGLIPGHGGMLDRIDSLLFAAPVYYAVVRLVL